jgi:hypothetical protein
MRRHTLGIIAAVLLLTAAALWLFAVGGQYEQLQGIAWRLGAFLAVWWLAYPDVDRLPGWLLVVLPATALIIAVRPKLLLWAIPILIVLALLRPRVKKR